jgi:hypothetical protein
MELPSATKVRARQVGWEEALIERLEESPARPDQVLHLVEAKITGERVSGWLDFVINNPDNPFAEAPLFAIRTDRERLARLQPSENGLLLEQINTGTYGVVPDRWPYENDTPRGSTPIRGQHLPASYSIYDKSEVWAAGLDRLYEEAIQDRWVPSTDLDWEAGLQDLPEEMERSVCQLATVYSNHGLIEQKILAKRVEEISYGFHEVKLFVATQIYDAGRKAEALRKRSLANGGGLGQAPYGQLYRGWYGALKWTDMIVQLDVVYKSYEVSLFEAAAEYVQTDLERNMFALLARDSRRHLRYGLTHLEWYLNYHGDRAAQNVRFLITRGELALSNELSGSAVEREALVLLLAGGMETLSAGVEKLRVIREKQLQDYIANLDSIGFDRLPRVSRTLKQLAEDPLANGVNSARPAAG